MSHRRWTAGGGVLLAALLLAGCAQAEPAEVVDCWLLDKAALKAARAQGQCEDALALNRAVVHPKPPPLPARKRVVSRR